jgi:hypothetical protein
VVKTDRPGAVVTVIRMGKGFEMDLDMVGAGVAEGSTKGKFKGVLSRYEWLPQKATRGERGQMVRIDVHWVKTVQV